MIPAQLQNPAFRFIKVAAKSKRPIEDRWHAVAVLKENDPDDEHLWDEEIAVLRAMLTEAAI